MSVKPSFFRIENVVATADLHQSLALDSVAKALRGSEYNPQRFPGVVYRLRKPKASALIFRTGKMVCTGARSAGQAKRGVGRIVEELKLNGFVILNKPEVTVQNIVASGDLGGSIDLEEYTYAMKGSIYEPEQFPGVISRMEDPHVVFLVFSSGKLVCVGAKNEEQVGLAVNRLRDTLKDKNLLH